jgi:hypothetical protein
MRLFIGASYASGACYLMDDRDVINIGLRTVKRCGMYAKDTKIGFHMKMWSHQLSR